MANFSVRVEMHRASDAQYTQLHNAMYAAGYNRTVVGADGVTYSLPTAMYNKSFTGVVTAVAVRDQVQAIAHAIDNNAWVYVVRYDEDAWFLSKVAKAA